MIVGQVYTSLAFIGNTYIKSIGSGVVTMSTNATATDVATEFTTYDVCTISVKVNTLVATLKNNVSIVLYRTTNNGTIFYRTSSLTSLSYNAQFARFCVNMLMDLRSRNAIGQALLPRQILFGHLRFYPEVLVT